LHARKTSNAKPLGIERRLTPPAQPRRFQSGYFSGKFIEPRLFSTKKLVFPLGLAGRRGLFREMPCENLLTHA